MSDKEIAERVMIQHGMTSLDAFGKRMTMGEMRRMLEHAANLARKEEFEAAVRAQGGVG